MLTIPRKHEESPAPLTGPAVTGPEGSSEPTAGALMHAFEAAFARPSREAAADLQAASAAFGRQARTSGLSPQQLVLSLKRLLFKHADFAGLPSLDDAGAEDRPTARPMYGKALTWCLDGYFAESQKPDPRP